MITNSNLELEASNYAIKFFDEDKTYTSLEVHKMICDAYIAGATRQDSKLYMEGWRE